MSRRRTEQNAHLPENVRCRKGYYTWRNPVSRTEHGLGRDAAAAIVDANRRNALLARPVAIVPTALTLERVVAGAIPLQMTCAIYFLLAGSEVVYVGQSANVHKRISEHIADRVISFDRFYVEPCERSLLDIFEAQCIAQFRPRYNKLLNLRTTYAETTV